MFSSMFWNDNFFLVFMPTLAPILVLLAWLFRQPWPAWIASGGLLPFCLYIGFVPQFLFLPWLAPPLVALGAWQLERRRPANAFAFFAGFLGLWLAYFLWLARW